MKSLQLQCMVARLTRYLRGAKHGASCVQSCKTQCFVSPLRNTLVAGLNALVHDTTLLLAFPAMSIPAVGPQSVRTNYSG